MLETWTRRSQTPAAAALLAGALAASPLLGCAGAPGNDQPDPRAPRADVWPAYGNDPGGTRYSPASRITPGNVARLEVAWTYRTGDLIEGRTRFQATPLLIDGVLFVTTSFGRVIALDPERGFERWSFNPGIDVHGDYADFANRGVAHWRDTDRADAEPCRDRLYVAPIDARLIALDAASGRPCADFGSNGTVDLRAGLLNDPDVGEAAYQVTSPPVVVSDLVIVGSAISDNGRVDAPSGVVRAFDARTGERRWGWDPIPRDDADDTADQWRGHQARTTGAANVWTVMSADPVRDLVFLPTSSPSPDFYGGERIGDNRHANSLVALRASTGELVWSFQAVHHDVWDYDLPAQPLLTTIDRDGESVPIVAQATKMGFVYVLHRETGEPVFPIEERPVPGSDVPGEIVSPTQPFPTIPAPLSATAFDGVWGATDRDRAWCAAIFDGRRNDGIFTPPSLEGSVLTPGNIGGINWSGIAVDATRGILLAPTTRLSTIVQLIPREEAASREQALRAEGWEVSPQRGTPYAMARTFPLSPSGAPCDPPPWGTLTAIDLATGERRWRTPLGAWPGTESIPEATGSLVMGGPIVTAGGLTFVAGTLDAHLRAFDTETGAELWSAALPAAAHATPMTYERNGRQFVVITAGGHGDLPSRPGDHVVAFSLPEHTPPRARLDLDALAGRYAGYLRVEGTDLDVTADLAVRDAARATAGGLVTGRLRVPAVEIDAPLTGTPIGDALSLEIPFTSGTLGCSGVIRATVSSPGIDGRLAGAARVSGGCSDDEPENGRLSLDGEPGATTTPR